MLRSLSVEFQIKYSRNQGHVLSFLIMETSIDRMQLMRLKKYKLMKTKTKTHFGFKKVLFCFLETLSGRQRLLGSSSENLTAIFKIK